MSVKELGYLDYFGEKCVYIQEDMNYILAPLNSESNIKRHFMEENYHLIYSSDIYNKCVALVKKQIGSNMAFVCLELAYICKRLNDDQIDGFIMVGNEIDEFFSPLEYYFGKQMENLYKTSDLLYGQDVAEQYQFICENKQIQIDLVYGNVLTEGIRSDLTLHPQLIVKFEGTRDTDFVYNVYLTIVKFLQTVHRKITYNIKNIQLFHNTEKGFSAIGYLFASLYNRDLRASSRSDASFIYYGQKISNILSIISAEKKYPIHHLNATSHNPYEYTTERLGAVSAAFEYEYGKSKLYPQKSELSCGKAKQLILDYIDDIQTEESGLEFFKENAKEKICNLGRKPGLKTKILNAYKSNSDAFKNSLDFLLIEQEDVGKVATKFADLRGKVLHNETEYIFDESETRIIRFVEVLQYVMLLKRASYTDQEIELILGPLYHCNCVYLKRLSSNTNE